MGGMIGDEAARDCEHAGREQFGGGRIVVGFDAGAFERDGGVEAGDVGGIRGSRAAAANDESSSGLNAAACTPEAEEMRSIHCLSIRSQRVAWMPGLCTVAVKCDRQLDVNSTTPIAATDINAIVIHSHTRDASR
jgi:hypothetical protein